MENQTEEQQALDSLFNYAADLMINKKMNALNTRIALQEQGLDEENAIAIVNKIRKEIKKAEQAQAKKDMLYGGLWCVGGIVVTLFTYASASGGGRYVVAWGAILYGGIKFFTGLKNSN